jgi:hypothetical protein
MTPGNPGHHPTRPHVSAFWHGAALTKMEQLCINSFLAHGFRYFLYVYQDPPKGVPPGVEIRDAGTIVDEKALFVYENGTFNRGSVSGFSNLFRYALIGQIGGWWADTDHCCLRPMPVNCPEFYVQERTRSGEFRVANGFFRGEPNDPMLHDCLQECWKRQKTVVHGETGPRLFTQAVIAYERGQNVNPFTRYLPVPWWEWQRLFYDETLAIDEWVTLHFWNSHLRASQLDKDGVFPPNSVFERLKRIYL